MNCNCLIKFFGTVIILQIQTNAAKIGEKNSCGQMLSLNFFLNKTNHHKVREQENGGFKDSIIQNQTLSADALPLSLWRGVRGEVGFKKTSLLND
jgi:hypothetical protein